MAIATISVLIANRAAHSVEVQKVLSDFGEIIISRTGLNLMHSQWKKAKAGLVVLVVEGELEKIDKLQERLDNVAEVDAKYCLLTKEND